MVVGIHEVLSLGGVPEITGNDVSFSVVLKSALSLEDPLFGTSTK